MRNKLIVLMMLAAILIVTACSSSGSADKKLFVHGDLVLDGACVLQSRYTPGESIVFRVDVIDVATDKQAEEATVKVHLSNGETLDMVYGPHGDVSFWTVRYDIPEDAQLGTLNYYVTADGNNKSGEFHPFDVPPSLLTIVAKEEA